MKSKIKNNEAELTEQMINKTPIIEFVKANMAYQDKEIETAKGKIERNFSHAFEWGYHEDQYKADYTKGYLEDLMQKIEDVPDAVETWLKEHIQRLTEDLLNGRYRNRSSSEFANIAFIARKECAAQLIKEFSYWLAMIEKGAPIKKSPKE